MQSILINSMNKKLAITLFLVLLGIINPWNKALAVSHHVPLFVSSQQEIKIMPDYVFIIMNCYSKLSLSNLLNPWGYEESEANTPGPDVLKNTTREQVKKKKKKKNNPTKQHNPKQVTNTNQGWSIKNLWSNKFLLISLCALMGVGYCTNSTTDTLSPYNDTTGMLGLDHQYNNGTNITDMESPYIGIIMTGTLTVTQIEQNKLLSLKKAKYDLEFILQQHNYEGTASYNDTDGTLQKLKVNIADHNTCGSSRHLNAEFYVVDSARVKEVTIRNFQLIHIKVSGNNNTKSMNPQKCGNNPCNDYPNYFDIPSTNEDEDSDNQPVAKVCPPVWDSRTPVTVIAFSSINIPPATTNTSLLTHIINNGPITLCQNSKKHIQLPSSKVSCFICGANSSLKAVGMTITPKANKDSTVSSWDYLYSAYNQNEYYINYTSQQHISALYSQKFQIYIEKRVNPNCYTTKKTTDHIILTSLESSGIIVIALVGFFGTTIGLVYYFTKSSLPKTHDQLYSFNVEFNDTNSTSALLPKKDTKSTSNDHLPNKDSISLLNIKKNTNTHPLSCEIYEYKNGALKDHIKVNIGDR